MPAPPALGCPPPPLTGVPVPAPFPDKDGNVVICGIMQHIEQAGVHSGDSACSIPPQTISDECLAVIRDWTPKLAKALKVVGLINIQYAVQDNQVCAVTTASRARRRAGARTPVHTPPPARALLLLTWPRCVRARAPPQVYIIEANPRASRTVPFVAKAVGHPLAKYASLLMAGATLSEIGFTEEPKLNHVAVKEAVLPFDKFQGADTLLGPEMRSTGEERPLLRG